ncbi:hypothetical protein ACF0H5_021425 [Mactra antiquata]
MATSERTQLNMSEETFDYICTGCDKKNKTLKAVKYCVECKEYFCVSCTDMHNNFSYLMSHSLLDVEQAKQSGNQAESSPEFPTERCCIHKGKVLDMYCAIHNDVGCYVCMAKNHKTCPESQICSIPDMVDTLFNLSDSQQTQSRLQQMIVTLTSLSESKDNQLEILKEAEDKCIEQIEKFHNVLQQIIRRAAEASKKEVKDEYQRLEADILQDKSIINGTNDVLQKTDYKLKKASGNRAQRFVCSKEAENHIKKAEDEKMKQETDNNTDVDISFCPNNKLMDYIQGLHGLGDVLVANKKRNLYMLKGSRDINIKVSDDTSSCSSWGCCLTYDNQLLLTDYNNKKIKRVETHTFSVVDYITSDSRPQGICCINQHEVVVGCHASNKIQFVSIENKMTPTRKIDTSHDCYGIAMKDDNLYVTDYNTSLYAYDMNGTLLRTIASDNDGNILFSRIRHIVFNESGDKMFVGDESNKLVCFDGKGNYKSTIKDSDLNVACGVCTDGRGNIFVGGRKFNNVVQFNEDGTKTGVIVKQEDGLKDPRSISFDRGQNRMFVTMNDSDILKMYELE